jgi:hypothetical protein
MFSTVEFIIYFLAKVKKILPFLAFRIIQQLAYFFFSQMTPLAFFKAAQLEITYRFTHEVRNSVTDCFKSPSNDPVFPLSQSKPQPAAFIIDLFHFKIFRFEKIIIRFNPFAQLS